MRSAEIGNNSESPVLPSTDVMRLSNYAGINVRLIGRQANKGMAAASIKTKTFPTRGQMLAGRQMGGWEGVRHGGYGNQRQFACYQIDYGPAPRVVSVLKLLNYTFGQSRGEILADDFYSNLIASGSVRIFSYRFNLRAIFSFSGDFLAHGSRPF